MNPVTGEIGKQIVITGSGIYSINRVVFSGGYNNTGVSATFSEIEGWQYNVAGHTGISGISGAMTGFATYGTFLTITVPPLAAWGTIRIDSDSRRVTGYSKWPFVPAPIISGFSPASGLSGTVVLVSGYSFSGINEVTVNNLSASFNILSHTGLEFIVPSGNVNGKVKLSGKSGVSALSAYDFVPLAHVTGLSIYSGTTGTTIGILGENFFPNIMYNVSGNEYLVTFNNATGLFERVNNSLLTGYVPYQATSGTVSINKETAGVYYSNISFTVFEHLPQVTTGIYPFSGAFGHNHTIRGQNFYDITGVLLSGTGTIMDLLGMNKASVSFLGDIIFFEVPVAADEGYHDVILRASGVGETVLPSGFYVVYPPEISGFDPKIGSSGDMITVSGQYLYHYSKCYLNNTVRLEMAEASSDNRTLKFILPSEGAKLLETGNTIYINNTIGLATGGYFYFVPQAQYSGMNRLTGTWQDQVIISGSGLNFITGVYFSTGYVSFSLVGNNQIGFDLKTGMESNVAILYSSGLGGTITTPQLEILYPLPYVSGVNNTGNYIGNTIIITGANLKYVTGIAFSGESLSGKWVNATGFLVDTSGNIRVEVPSNAVTGPILLGNNSGTITGSYLDIIRSPTISGSSRYSGVYLDTVLVSGNFFRSSSQVYFWGVNDSFVPGVDTVVNTSKLITTKVPTGIKYGFFYITGITGEMVNCGYFIPFPSVTGFTPSTVYTDDNRNVVTITGINCYHLASGYLMLTGSGRFLNLCDDATDIRINLWSTTGLGYTIITGLIQPNFSGSGKLALVSTYQTGDVLGSILTTETGFAFSSKALNIIQANPTVSGILPLSGGGQGTTFSLSGRNLNLVDSLDVWFPIPSYNTDSQVITSKTSKTLIFTMSHDYDITQTGQIRIYHSVTGTSPEIQAPYFNYSDTPRISGVKPGQVLTGSYVVVSGTDLYFTSGVYLTNSEGDRIPILFYKVIVEDDYFGTYHISYISGYVPGSLTVSNKDWNVEIETINGTVTGSVKIWSRRDVENQKNLERDAYILGWKGENIFNY